MEGIGGERLVRRLGGDPGAHVHLARLDGRERAGADVVVKLYRPDVDPRTVSIEIEALARAVGEHVVALLDVSTVPSGHLALVLARASGGSLSRVLAHRLTLSLGEVAGILVPLAETVDALHRAGVAHGGVRPDAVLFDAAGAPVLACFGRASLLQPGLPPALLDQESAVLEDRAALAALARTVIERCESFETVRPILDALEPAPPGELAARLRALAEPAAIDLRAASPAPVASPIPARLPLRVEDPPRRAVHRSTREVTDLLAGIVDHRLLRRLLEALRAVRLRVWALAGSVLVALILAIVLVPLGGGPEAVDAAQSSSAPMATTAAPAPVDEDPVDALVRLLEERQRCIDERSVLCLDAVAQPGSSALLKDQELVLALQGGAETPPEFLVEAERVTIVERLGDAVLLVIEQAAESQPGSVLIARGDRGWLLRDFLEG